MLAVSTTEWWVIGWAVGGTVVVVAASLLLIVIAYARQIARQAHEIVVALDGARLNTEPLFELAIVNHSLERIERTLRELRAKPATGWLDAATSVLRRRLPGGRTE